MVWRGSEMIRQGRTAPSATHLEIENMKLYIDLETYSPTPIRHGVYRYAEKAEILLFAYAFGEGEAQVLEDTMVELPIMVEVLEEARRKGMGIMAHNSQFDRVILAKYWPWVNDLVWQDSMIRARAHSLPGKLADLCDIYKVPEDKAKEKEGKALIQWFCVPDKDGNKRMPNDWPEKWASFKSYAASDIQAMRYLDQKLPLYNDTYTLWSDFALDQKINDRGLCIDYELVDKAIDVAGVNKSRLDADILDKTTGDVEAATQRDRLLSHIKDVFGITFPDLRKSTVERRIDDENLPVEVRELLALRLLGSQASISKYKAVHRSINSDSRLRGTLRFMGAMRTGRWAGNIFQPQNLPRIKVGERELEGYAQDIKSGAADLIYGDVGYVLKASIRGVIVAPDGCNLAIADYANIEGRVLAWLAGQLDKVELYRKGEDLYKITYANMFGAPLEAVDKEQRTIGKVLELAMGYGGGVGAFVVMAPGYGVDLAGLADAMYSNLPVEERRQAHNWFNKAPSRYGLSETVFVTCDTLKRLWRKVNPDINSFWYDLQDAAMHVIQGDVNNVGFRGLELSRDKNWFLVKLPSGRYLCYPACRIENGEIRYRGVNQYSRKWSLLKTYGGKLTENIVQAVSRDLLMCALHLAEKEMYRTVLTVHDEIIAECSEDKGHEGLCKIMCRLPTWAGDLPIAAEGFTTKRYRKE